MKKRVFTVLALLLVAFSAYSVTWTWSSPYRNTFGYRYQFNTDQNDNWTYVGPDVTSLTVNSVPRDTTLYVQLSIDGETWSPSGMATYVVEPETVAKAPVFREPVIMGAAEERLNRDFEFSIDLDLGTDVFYTDHLNIAPYLGGVLDFKNIYSPSYWFGLGLRARGGASFTPENGNIISIFTEGRGFADLSMSGYLDLSLALSFIIADSVDFTVSAGGGLSALNSSVPTLFSLGDWNMGSYVIAGASIDRYFGQVFHIGLSYNFKHYFGKGELDPNMHAVGVHLGLTF